MLQNTKRQVKLFEMHCFTMFITALCVIFFMKNLDGRRTGVSKEDYLKKAGLASRNIVHLRKIILRCVDFCFYFLKRKLVIFILENKFLCHVFNSA